MHDGESSTSTESPWPYGLPAGETISLRDQMREHRRSRRKGLLREHDYQPRPQIRAHCEQGIRPCPYISCRHHLYLDVNPKGTIKFNFGDDLDSLEYMEDTCSLDVADRGAQSRTAAATKLNICRERISQIEDLAIANMKDAVTGLAEDDDLPEHEREDLPGPIDEPMAQSNMVPVKKKDQIAYLHEPAARLCLHCAKPLTKRQTSHPRPQKFCSHTCAQTARRTTGLRRCARCKLEKSKDSYARYSDGSMRKSCESCFDGRYSEKFKTGENWAPNPCVVCNQMYKTNARPCRRATRKMCSKACQTQAMRKHERQCRRCGDTLGAHNASRAPSGRIRPFTCKVCEGLLYAKSGSAWYYRPSLKVIMGRAARDAQKASLPNAITRDTGRQLYAQPCAMCAAISSHWVLVERSRGYIVKNIKPLCEPCLRVNRLMPWPQGLLYCLKVAKAQKAKQTAKAAEAKQ